jgi:REP element-mobilizing transposase RayT
MPSTFLSLNYHIVFSTKNRTPSLPSDRLATVHQYLGGTINGLGGVALAGGGVADHVHALVGLRATHCLADFLREFKKSTTLWVQAHIGRPDFAWQEGYAAFTVGATSCDSVRRYIAQQAEHHRVKSFREELVEM